MRGTRYLRAVYNGARDLVAPVTTTAVAGVAIGASRVVMPMRFKALQARRMELTLSDSVGIGIFIMGRSSLSAT